MDCGEVTKRNRDTASLPFSDYHLSTENRDTESLRFSTYPVVVGLRSYPKRCTESLRTFLNGTLRGCRKWPILPISADFRATLTVVLQDCAKP